MRRPPQLAIQPDAAVKLLMLEKVHAACLATQHAAGRITRAKAAEIIEAWQKAVDRAYRLAARECHPDLHPDLPGGNERMKQLSQSRETLQRCVPRAQVGQSAGPRPGPQVGRRVHVNVVINGVHTPGTYRPFGDATSATTGYSNYTSYSVHFNGGGGNTSSQ